MGLLDRVRALRPLPVAGAQPPLPDPSKPPQRRGEWDEAALTNVEITEVIKRQLRTNTRPWQK